MALPTEIAAPAAIALDVYQRQSSAVATFGLSEIVPAVIWAVGAFKSKPKTGAEYVQALYNSTLRWNALVKFDPTGSLKGSPPICKAGRCTAAIPPRLHPYQDIIELIQQRENVPRKQAESLFRETLSIYQQKRLPMALNIGGILGTVGTIFGGGQNPVFSGISNVANLASQFFPTPASVPAVIAPQQLAARPPASSLGMLPAIGRGTVAVGRGFFNRFPNLATAIQQLRDRGQNVTRGQLWSLLKRFGPEVVITGGLLTAAAVSELMVAGPGRRRMNPANVHALRRAGRRIKSFHKLCQVTDLIKTRRTYGGSRRCGTCRKSPCRC